MKDLLEIIGKHVKGSTTRILEIGCGDGKLINAIAASLPYTIVHALDRRVPEYLEENIIFRAMDVEKEDIQLHNIDLIIINHTLEHIKNPVGLLENLKSHLSPHGKILIVVPNKKGYANEARTYIPEHGKHYFLWDEHSLGYTLERLGFVPRFFHLHKVGEHTGFLKYLAIFLGIQNPNLICVAMLDSS